LDKHKVSIDIPNGFDAKFEVAIKETLSATANDFAKILRNEIPKGETGKARDSVVVVPASKLGGINITSVVKMGVGIKYIWALWKGIPRGEQLIHPRYAPRMRFPIGRWKTWGGIAQPDKGGYFNFSEVKRFMPANPFVERALAKWDVTAKGKISNFFAKIINR